MKSVVSGLIPSDPHWRGSPGYHYVVKLTSLQIALHAVSCLAIVIGIYTVVLPISYHQNMLLRLL
jgi:hypothetical protein